MQTTSFSTLEATFLNKFNEGHKSFEALKNNVPFNEKTLNQIIETLLAKNVIKFDTAKKEYKYDTPVEGDKLILDGSIMLPVTIIKMKDHILVSRGEWYRLPLDFDIRRIIWNVQLPNNTKSTLVDLVKESSLKEKRSKIVQLEEYKPLVNKLIPWSNNILLKINAVGAEVTDVSIIFRDRLYLDPKDKIDFVEFREFSVRSEIKTDELIPQLTCTPTERDFQKISINRIFNFTDFIFSNNSIPYLCDDESINYAKITAIKGRFEITYYRFSNSGQTEKLSSDEFLNVGEGIERMRELFAGYAQALINDNDILVELTD